jgi:REP element-mobilizing transposase RayT
MKAYPILASMSSKYKIGDQSDLYFVTYATVGWVDVFTRTAYRNIILESLNHCSQHKGLNVHAWCLMTNHVHLIIGTSDKPIETIMRDHKRHTSETIHKALKEERESRREWMMSLFTQAGTDNKHNRGFQLWQQDYHPICLKTGDLIRQRLDYTHNNPVKAGFVEEPHHWSYSSAVAYGGGHSMLSCLKILEP